jgi:hypothetical protein
VSYINEWFSFTLKPSWSEMFCLAIGLEYFVGDSDSIRGGGDRSFDKIKETSAGQECS